MGHMIGKGLNIFKKYLNFFKYTNLLLNFNIKLKQKYVS